MPITEAYKEHIIYTFHAFCKVVIRNAAMTAWRRGAERAEPGGGRGNGALLCAGADRGGRA